MCISKFAFYRQFSNIRNDRTLPFSGFEKVKLFVDSKTCITLHCIFVNLNARE